jgi:hypothetical protein
VKVLIGTYEIAGWVQQYKKGFEALGHSVTTAIYSKSEFFDYEYDHYLNDYYYKGRIVKEVQQHQYLQRLIRKVRNTRVDAAYKKFIHRLIDEHDLIIIFWSPFMADFSEYEYIRSKGKKLVCMFVGSDARYFRAFQQEYNVSNWTFPEEWVNADPGYRLQFVRNAEKFSDLIYSVPDQAGFQLKPYHHLQVPIDLNGINFRNNKRAIPKVLHAPSIPFKKGTDIIEATLARLKEEGIPFEFISIRNTPHQEVLKLLTEIDVLVDEIVFHGPGALSFEAMFSGCAVATRYLQDSPACFKPPVRSINADNIYEQLKELLTNASLRNELIEAGRSYVMQNNTAEIVARGILNNLERAGKFDYHPYFLRDHYDPRNNDEASLINKWTDFVKPCDWYSSYVGSGSRGSLNF